jgi:hypothetical protein
MSAIEQEPLQVSGVAIAAVETVLAAISVPGVTNDKTLSALSAPGNPNTPTNPFKVIRVRGLCWVTGTASLVTLRLRQGTGIAGVQVGPTLVQIGGGTATANTPIPFEFIDAAPSAAGLNYSLTALGAPATTMAAITNVTGFTV